MLNFDPANNPEPRSLYAIVTKSGVRDYVMGTFQQEIFRLNPLRGFFSQYITLYIHPMYATHVCYFFWSFHSPTAETLAWILTLNTSNDAVLCKDDPFDGYKSEISYLTDFFGKFEKNTIVIYLLYCYI